MKNIIPLLLIVLISFACSKNDEISIQQSEFFIKFYGSSLNDVGYDLLQDSDNGYVLVGTTTNTNKETDIILIKTDIYGNEVWNRTFGDSLNDKGYSIQKTSDGGFVIAGSKKNAVENEDVWLIKTDNQGILLWEKTYGNQSVEEGFCVKQTVDGGYIIVGYSDEQNPGNGNPQGEKDILLVRTNANGDSLWAKRYGGSFSETGIDVCQKEDKGFIIMGTTFSFAEPGQDGSNIVLIETNELGLLIDKFTYGGIGNEAGFSLVKLSDGYLLAGVSINSVSNSNDIYCIRTGTNIHDLTWEVKLGGTKAEYCENVILTNNGNFIIVGATESFGEGNVDSYIIEIDNDGNEVRSTTLGGAGDEKANSIIESSVGGYAFVGSTLTEENSMISLTKINENFELK